MSRSERFLNSNETFRAPPLHGEILYSRNNVCIHPPSLLSNTVTHHAGFLTITANVKTGSYSLILNWSPTEIQKKSLEKCEKTETEEVLDSTEDGQPCIEVESSLSPFRSSLSESKRGYDDEPHHGVCFEEKASSEVNERSDLKQGRSAASSYHGFVIRPPKNQAFAAFNIDLAEMRSLRLFFRDDACMTGELLIASHESQYKMLHFHHAGLDCVAEIFKDWKSVIMDNKNKVKCQWIENFSFVLPSLSAPERHPEEDLYRGLTVETWALSVDEFGRLENKWSIQKAVFFGGVDKMLRSTVWPFLLKYYTFDSSIVERNEIREKKSDKYGRLNICREKLMATNEDGEFWKNVACSIEKDVLRTDRANPFFSGEGNPNLEILERILLNYSVYTKTSYTQGMSDLLSPLLMEIREESDVFWCFVGLMQRTIFISSPSDSDMEKQLFYLKELLRILLPGFYEHLMLCGSGAFELLFAHRWILLCFKREFSESEALKIWEACWAHYQTNYFHLFVCVAIIALYGRDVVESKLACDEMLLHFSQLSMQMNGDLVLRKARGLLHTLRLSAVPCTLSEMFYISDSEHQDLPKIKCIREKACDGGCPHGGTIEQSNSVRYKLGKLLTQSL
ncbi:unnamed protein product [Clavelina lepadiformis]|uniref:Rab-GAP TBC domain-containing protein n=1 Tax=Clavelina lepadiformis TaxID=159417 RepID=A0ABP0FGL5_CLALP